MSEFAENKPSNVENAIDGPPFENPPFEKWLRLVRSTRPLPVGFLALLFAMLIAFNALANFFAIPDPQSYFSIGVRIEEATRGLLNLTFLLNASWMALIFGILLAIGKLRLRDLGLDSRTFVTGAIGFVVIALLELVIQLVASRLEYGEVVWSEQWTADNWQEAAGYWIGQLFGNALFEEAIYRGLFIGQVLLVQRKFGREIGGSSLFLALVVSQSAFAGVHLPADYLRGNFMVLPIQFVAGIFLALAYLETANLWLVVGVHSLLNAPPSIIDSSLPHGIVAGMVLVVLFAKFVFARVSTRGKS